MNDFTFRLATLADLEWLLAIFERARRFMASVGNPNQWIQGYPGRSLMEAEIAASHCYVCLYAGHVVGTFCFLPGPDANYRVIEAGEWLSDAPYHVLHRLASDGSVRGIADACLDWCFQHTSNLRVDTHRDNKVLQHILAKHGFSYCGIIYVANGTPRLAYQKIVSNNQTIYGNR